MKTLTIDPKRVFVLWASLLLTAVSVHAQSLIPGNDVCADAYTINCGFSMTGNTDTAQSDMAGVTCDVEADAPGIWFKAAPGTGEYAANVCAVTSFDSRILVFQGDCNDLVCVAGNEDWCGEASRVEWPAHPTDWSYIYVTGVGGQTGSIQLQLQCYDCGDQDLYPNDTCAGAIDVLDQEYQGSTCCAGVDDPDLCTTTFAVPNGVWFKANSGSFSDLNFTLTNLTGVDIALTIYEDQGGGCGDLLTMACAGPVTNVIAGNLDPIFGIEPNTDYYFFVNVQNVGNCGSYSFTVNGEGGAIAGCTDATACNYNPAAATDDGSCTYPGCTNAAAVNYDATAGCDDGSCVVVNACAEWDLLFGDEPLAASYTLGRAVAALPDGRFAVAGVDYAEIGDGMLGVVSSTGALLEYHIAGDIGDVEEYAEDVVVCGAGGYAIAGSRENYLGDTSNDFWLARFDENGAVLWTQSYGTFAVEVAVEVHEMDNGNFVLGGYQTDGNGYAYVVMTDANGDVLWEATYEQPGEDHQFLDMEVTSTGEIVLAGAAIIEAQPFPSPIAVAFDTAGNFLWETVWSEPGFWRGVASSPEGELRFFGNDTFANTALLGTRDAGTGAGSVQEVLGGSLIDGLHASTGWVAIGSNAALQDPSTGATPNWILGLDDAGSITWSCVVGASMGNTIEVQDITRSANGEWVVAGIADGQSAFVERFAANGNTEVLGCTSTLACNYAPSATFEDGTCVFPGCTDALACNYDADAGCDDGTCAYPNPGEDCSGICLEDSDGDGVCDQNEVPGCTAEGACNYLPEATDNDGSCFFANAVFDCEGNCQVDLNNNGVCDQLETGACSGPDCCGNGTLWDPAQGICIAFDQCPADVNEDGVVDAIDILDLIGGYGSVCP